MKPDKADRERLIHERALKIQREQGSDVYRTEDYHALAKRLIEEEEEIGQSDGAENHGFLDSRHIFPFGRFFIVAGYEFLGRANIVLWRNNMRKLCVLCCSDFFLKLRFGISVGEHLRGRDQSVLGRENLLLFACRQEQPWLGLRR